MLTSTRIWVVTGALFLALLPSLPLGIAQLQAGTSGCDMQNDSACRRLCASMGHSTGEGQVGPTEDSCPNGSCSVRSQPSPDGTPAEGSTVRQAVTPKAAPGDGALVAPAQAASSWLNAATASLPPNPCIEIQLPPPRPLRLV